MQLNKTDATFEELSQLYEANKQKLQLIETALNKTDATFEELSQVYDANKQKFEALTSKAAAGIIYRSRGEAFQELSQLHDADLEKFKALTSEAALFLYDKDVKFTDISVLYTSDPAKYHEIMNVANNALHRANADELIEQVNNMLSEEKNKPKEKRKFTDDIKDRRQQELKNTRVI